MPLRSHAGVERSRGIAPFGGQDETQGVYMSISHGLHLRGPWAWPARTIRKVSWPWATDSSGRRRLAAGVADPSGFADAGLAALGKG